MLVGWYSWFYCVAVLVDWYSSYHCSLVPPVFTLSSVCKAVPEKKVFYCSDIFLVVFVCVVDRKRECGME